MKSLAQWLSLYGESHQNSTNKLIHYLCVPAIYFTVIVFLANIPWPISQDLVWLNWATIALIAATLFYLKLSFRLGLIMGLISAGMLYFIIWWQSTRDTSLVTWAVGIFVIAWILQFVGHKIEGKKPSFFNDVQFLLIGPAWIIADLFRIKK